MRRYRSDIPRDAEERITSKHHDGSTAVAFYYLDGNMVGMRQWDVEGFLLFERPFANGHIHGTEYRWESSDWLLSAEPYRYGKPHGVARQWDENGRLIGQYVMKNGTGIDLWFDQWEDGRITLAEAVYLVDGQGHGFDWRFDSFRQTLRSESHWQHGQYHGIVREWSNFDKLRRGFPKYYIRLEQVTKRQYLRACKTDPTLPPFRERDNKPTRIFPPRRSRST